VTLALTGGTGFVGQAVLDVLAKRQQSVRALARTVPKEPGRAIEWVQGSLDDTVALAELVSGVETVIHIAGLTTSHDPAELDRANAAGTLALVEAARAAGVRRLVFVSSLAAREPALSAYGASKSKAETIVAASGLDWTTVRPPGVYGPRDKDYLDLFKAAKWGVVPMPPPGRSSLIHVHDLAELLLALVPGGEGVTGMVFEPDDGRADGWSHRELARTIGWAVGNRPWVPHLSAGMLGRLSRLDRRLRSDTAKLTADRVSYMVHPDWVCDPARAVPAEVWAPRVPTRPGLKGTARWYREQGWL
jgi:nucleoside-diphosphate-sugar epimerase